MDARYPFTMLRVTFEEEACLGGRAREESLCLPVLYTCVLEELQLFCSRNLARLLGRL